MFSPDHLQLLRPFIQKVNMDEMKCWVRKEASYWKYDKYTFKKTFFSYKLVSNYVHKNTEDNLKYSFTYLLP